MHMSVHGQHEAYRAAADKTAAAQDDMRALRTRTRAAGSGWSAL